VSAPRFDPHDKAALDECVRMMRFVCDDLDGRIMATVARQEAGDVLRRLLVWQQTCEVQPQ
jgi:hypothetical protein